MEVVVVCGIQHTEWIFVYYVCFIFVIANSWLQWRYDWVIIYQNWKFESLNVKNLYYDIQGHHANLENNESF